MYCFLTVVSNTDKYLPCGIISLTAVFGLNLNILEQILLKINNSYVTLPIVLKIPMNYPHLEYCRLLKVFKSNIIKFKYHKYFYLKKARDNRLNKKNSYCFQI